MMFSCRLFLGLSVMALIRDVSSCDEHCADKPVFTPSSLVVEVGHSAFTSCSVCQHDCLGNIFNIEKSVGNLTTNGTTVTWTVDQLTEWHASPLCYYNTKTGDQCCTKLPVTVYQPPQAVSLHIDGGPGHTGPMVAGQKSTLVCWVHEVAPLGKVVVTFYRGQTPLKQLQYKSEEKIPMSDHFLFDVTLSKEDNGVRYWCEAKLELGPEGPQPPPVVTSDNVTATVIFKPQFEDQIHQVLVTVTVTAGESLQLNCSAVGNPSPSFRWTLPSNAPSSFNSSVLTINAIRTADAGQYTCSVSNSLGTVTKEFSVDVYVKPQFEDQIHQVPVTVTAGESLQLNCSAVGNPSPSYTWTLPSTAPSSSNSSVLTINAVRTADAGQYTCLVSNSLGTVTKEFSVDVYDNTWWIILIVVLVVVLLVIVALIVFRCYSKNHNGRYNLMDVFHLSRRHSVLPDNIDK